MANLDRCGSDAMRFCLAAYTTGGSDINFDVQVMHGYRKFANKIYQASKYVIGKIDSVEGFVPAQTKTLQGRESLAELWILSKMNTATKEVNDALEGREFMKAAKTVHQFILENLCDVYIENSKGIIQDGTKEEAESALQTLYSALETALLLIHPFMPFVTEELWQRLPRRPEDKTRSIMLARYPVPQSEFEQPAAEQVYELVRGAAGGIRSLVAEYALKEDAQLVIQGFDADSHKTLKEQVGSIRSLSGKGVGKIDIQSPSDARPTGCVAYPIGSTASVFLHILGKVDLDGEIEKASKKLEKATQAVEKQRKLVNGAEYIAKVAVATQEADQKRLADLEVELKGYTATIEELKQLKLE